MQTCSSRQLIARESKQIKKDNIGKPYGPDFLASSYIHLFSHVLLMTRCKVPCYINRAGKRTDATPEMIIRGEPLMLAE